MEREEFGCLGLIVGFMLGAFLIGYLVAAFDAKVAIRHGAATYTVNALQEPEFHWKDELDESGKVLLKEKK